MKPLYKRPAREFRVYTSSMEDRACEVQDTIALFDDVQKHLTDEHTAREVQHICNCPELIRA